MTIQQAMEHLKDMCSDFKRKIDGLPPSARGRSPLNDTVLALGLAAEALTEKAEREDPRPLTIEELRQIKGEPLWLDIYEWRVCYGTSTFRGSEYLEMGMSYAVPLTGYGESWFAYRHKPKGVQG